MNENRIVSGMLHGAVGDAWGYTVEFTGYKHIKHPVKFPDHMMVTDDTQMALALAKAIQSTPDHDDVETLWNNIIHEFIAWSVSPENNRAPGMTCMGSLSGIKDDVESVSPQEKVFYNSLTSLGSGAVMRVFPVMLMEKKYRYAAAILQAITTHHDPRAALSAIAMVHAWETLDQNKYTINDTLEFITSIDNDNQSWVNENIPVSWLSTLEEAIGCSLVDYFSMINEKDDHGLTLWTALDNARSWNMEGDVASFVGAGGWDSVSAVAIVLRGVEIMMNDGIPPLVIMESLIATSGDSDTLGTIFGHSLGWIVCENDSTFGELLTSVEESYQDKIREISSDSSS